MISKRVKELFTSEKYKTTKNCFFAECISADLSAEERKRRLETLLEIRDILSKADGIDPKDYDRVCMCIQILEKEKDDLRNAEVQQARSRP